MFTILMLVFRVWQTLVRMGSNHALRGRILALFVIEARCERLVTGGRRFQHSTIKVI